MKGPGTTSVEVRFGLRTPLVRPRMPIHLDAVLLYSAIGSGLTPYKAQLLLDQALGYEGPMGQGCYQASALFFSEGTFFSKFATRHFSPSEYAEDLVRGVVKGKMRHQINLTSGPVRVRLDEFPMRWASTATAWAQVLDPGALEELLLCVTSIGKHAHLGCGQVDPGEGGIQVQACEDATAWRRRVLPFPVEGSVGIHATVSPPYWDRTRAVPAHLHPMLLDGNDWTWC